MKKSNWIYRAAVWVWMFKARKRLANRAEVRAKALVEVARMGAPSQKAKYLGIDGGYFVYGLPPAVQNLTTVERTRLLLDGANAQLSYRKVMLKPDTVYQNALNHSLKTGEPLPSVTKVALGV